MDEGGWFGGAFTLPIAKLSSGFSAQIGGAGEGREGGVNRTLQNILKNGYLKKIPICFH